MIVVKVELHRASEPGKVTELARMTISNVGGTKTIGNYAAQVLRKPKFQTYVREAEVMGHKRLALPVWVLIARALFSMGYMPFSHYKPKKFCPTCGADAESHFEGSCAYPNCPAKQDASTG